MPQYVEVNGQTVEFPDGMQPAEMEAAIKGSGIAAAQPGSKEWFLKRETSDLSSNLRRGVKDVVDTGAELLASGYDKLTGGGAPTLSSLITGQKPQGEADRVRAMNAAGKQEWDQANSGQILPNVQRIGGNILGALPLTQFLGSAVGASGAPALGNAISTGGMTTGRAAPVTGDMLTRMLGGAANGYVSAGAVDPDSANTGGVIGAAMPPVLKAGSNVLGAIGRAFSAPAAAPNVSDAVVKARAAGLVIPPTQANPSLANRTIEGLAGKLTTAQNASARNQPVINEMAKKAIGATELTPEGLQAVRAQANAAYDALGQAGTFQADDGFRAAIKNATSRQAGMKADFPALANKEVEALAESLSSRPEFGAQSTMEAIKQLRFEASANKVAQDPTKKAMGQAQSKFAAALEDLVERNLEARGATDLLTGYREARTILAKTHDIEKALNQTSGNIDASKLAAKAKAGKLLTGELKTIADFAGTFPTAAKSVDKMGSLPGVSPLDFMTAAGISGATANPSYMAGVMARPAARALALSPIVQNSLLGNAAQQGASTTGGLLGGAADDLLRPLLYQSAPLLYSQGGR